MKSFFIVVCSRYTLSGEGEGHLMLLLLLVLLLIPKLSYWWEY